MSRNFVCEDCNYSTKDKSNWNKHLKSKKHNNNKNQEKSPRKFHTIPRNNSLNKEENCNIFSSPGDKWNCVYCGKCFSRKDALKRHQVENCPKYLLELEFNKGKIKDRELEFKDRTINQYEKELVYVKQLLHLSAEKGSKTIGNYNYINNTFTETEPLKEISYKVFAKNTKIRFIDNSDSEEDIYDSYSINKKNKPHNEQIVEDILYSYEHDILDSYLGDSIVKSYKDPDPSKQAIWLTDASRLKYIIRANDAKEIPRWLADVHGVQTSKLLIEPITRTLRDLLIQYQKKYCVPRKGKKYSYEEQEKIIQTNISIANVIGDIDDGKISKKVLKYIAKHFTIDKKNIEKKLNKIKKKKRKKKKEK